MPYYRLIETKTKDILMIRRMSHETAAISTELWMKVRSGRRGWTEDKAIQ